MWQWLSPCDEFWHLYDGRSQSILNAAKKEGANSVVMFIEGKCTVVNLKAMEHVDSSTGYSCKIRFIPAMKPSMLPPGYGSLPNQYNAFIPDDSAVQSACNAAGPNANAVIPAMTTIFEVPSSLQVHPSSQYPSQVYESTRTSTPPIPGTTTLAMIPTVHSSEDIPSDVPLCESLLNEVPLLPAITRMHEWLRGIEPPSLEDGEEYNDDKANPINFILETAAGDC